MKTDNLKIGDVFWVEHLYCRTPSLQKYVVTSIGRKYFKACVLFEDGRKGYTKEFLKSTGKIRNSVGAYSTYASLEDFEEEQNCASLRQEIRSAIEISQLKLSSKTLLSIQELLKSNI